MGGWIEIKRWEGQFEPRGIFFLLSKKKIQRKREKKGKENKEGEEKTMVDDKTL